MLEDPPRQSETTSWHRSFRALTRKEKAVIALLVTQPVCVIAVLVAQPGFDHPNELGLDFDFVVHSFGVFVVSWFIGLILACTLPGRRVWYVVGYLLSPLVCFGLAYLVGAF